MKPPRLLDPAFRYTPSYGTNLRKTFARVRREMAERERQERISEGIIGPTHKLVPIRKEVSK